MLKQQRIWMVLLATLVCLVQARHADAQAYPRSFQTALWPCCDGTPTKADSNSDVAVFGDGGTQPPGRSILILDWNTPLSTRSYDWSRILAVEVDEPFGSVPGSPCANGINLAIFASVTDKLSARANELAMLSPKTRFWVNYTPREVGWLKGGCSIVNQEFMDVVSEDRYYDEFYPSIVPDYDWLTSHPATSHQQVALVPGTFYRPGHDDPRRQAELLFGYFNYADFQNQNCNLDWGPRGYTGSYDGCRVWIVLGWLTGNWTDPRDGTLYVGLLDPRLQDTVYDTWHTEVAIPQKQIQRARAVQPIISSYMLTDP
jgi:hypothetical protein